LTLFVGAIARRRNAYYVLLVNKTQMQARIAELEAELVARDASDRALGRPSDVVAQLRELGLHTKEQENFVVILMNARQKVLSAKIVAIGTVSKVEVHPRDVFREAIRLNAHSIIIAHNHPSGGTEPSEADVTLTERLVSAGQVVGIPIVDHVIISRYGHTSFAEMGMI
jgi:DNA repair protein RadC